MFLKGAAFIQKNAKKEKKSNRFGFFWQKQFFHISLEKESSKI